LVVNFKVAPYQQRLFERQAKKVELMVSDYVSITLYLDMMMSSYPEPSSRRGTFEIARKRRWGASACPRGGQVGAAPTVSG